MAPCQENPPSDYSVHMYILRNVLMFCQYLRLGSIKSLTQTYFDRNILPKLNSFKLAFLGRYYSAAYYSANCRIFGIQQNISYISRQIAKIWVSVVL